MFIWQLILNKLFYINIKRYNLFMDKREFTVIKNEGKTDVVPEKETNKAKHQTNPIVKKLAKFHFEKAETFTVKDLFKK